MKYKILFLAVLSQALIDTIDDNCGLFKHKLKQFATSFRDELLKVMNKDIKNPVAVDQLIKQTVMIENMFYLNAELPKLSDNQQLMLSNEIQALYKKYMK
jgi:hypothetical protein